jgi:hypothetical protein
MPGLTSTLPSIPDGRMVLEESAPAEVVAGYVFWVDDHMTRAIWRAVKRKATKGKVADRPHSITIAIGVFTALSALVSTAALYVSTGSLETSQQSMKVGQRAYVGISDATVTYACEPSVLPHPHITDPIGQIVISYRFHINNYGNTPAQVVNVELGERDTPTYWKELLLLGNLALAGSTLEVGGKSYIPLKRSFTYMVPKSECEAMGHQMITIPAFPIRVQGSLKYYDIFKQEHSVEWCWLVNSDKYPAQCNNPYGQ